jgi:hypothetical protein
VTRSRRGPALLLAAAIALPLAAAVAVAASGPRAAEREDAEAVQHVLGGLGLGAAVDLSGCAACFDPRDGSACSQRHEPVPLGSFFCPAHSGG